MTKYEWETELKKNIHRLPKQEQDKALDYYNELFADKAEQGKSESQIIAEFGNPCDVADKILAEYQYDFRPPADETDMPQKERPEKTSHNFDVFETTETKEPEKAKESETVKEPEKAKAKEPISAGEVVSKTIESAVNVVGTVGKVALDVSVTVISVLLMIGAIALTVIGAILLAASVYGIVMSFITYISNGAAMAASVGIWLIAFGFGLLIVSNSKRMINGAKNLNGKNTDANKKTTDKEVAK